MNANDRYEHDAAEFLAATGKLAPGKDQPAAMGGAPSQEERIAAWDAYWDGKRKGAELYGSELILDLHECDPGTFTRESIGQFFERLCLVLGMSAEDLHYWDDLHSAPGEEEIEPHLVGTSAIQFIKTSNITIHTLDLMRRVYINVFSCKEFDADDAAVVCRSFFGGRIANQIVVTRV